MKKAYRNRQVFIDRLEKRYVKKIQLHAFKRESEAIKNELNGMRGASIDSFSSRNHEFFKGPDFRRTHS